MSGTQVSSEQRDEKGGGIHVSMTVRQRFRKQGEKGNMDMLGETSSTLRHGPSNERAYEGFADNWKGA